MCANKIKIKTFSIKNSSPLCPRQRSAILDITQRTDAAYCLPQRKDALFSFKLKRKYMYNTHPCIEADTEERTLRAFDGQYIKWRYADEERQRSLFLFSLCTKSILVAS